MQIRENDVHLYRRLSCLDKVRIFSFPIVRDLKFIIVKVFKNLKGASSTLTHNASREFASFANQGVETSLEDIRNFGSKNIKPEQN